MPEEHVTTENCRKVRDKIYGLIFPRWILMSIGGAFMLAMVLLYSISGSNKVAAADALKKAEIGEVRTQYLKEGQKEIKDDLKIQRAILHRIERKVNGR